jgi:hypothetical protein
LLLSLSCGHHKHIGTLSYVTHYVTIQLRFQTGWYIFSTEWHSVLKNNLMLSWWQTLTKSSQAISHVSWYKSTFQKPTPCPLSPGLWCDDGDRAGPWKMIFNQLTHLIAREDFITVLCVAFHTTIIQTDWDFYQTSSTLHYVSRYNVTACLNFYRLISMQHSNVTSFNNFFSDYPTVL